MAAPEHPDFNFDDSPQLFLFTSLTAGSSHIITATSRMETILKANRIPFRVVDIATTDKARQLWSRRSRDKKIPGLVKEGMVLGDLPVVEEWNEYGEIKMHLADAKGPTPHYVHAAPEISSAQETKLREAENDKASIKSAKSAISTSSLQQTHGQLAVEAAAAAAARKNNKSPLPVLSKTATQEVEVNDPQTEQNTIRNATAHSPPTATTDEGTSLPAPQKDAAETAAAANPVSISAAEADEELDEVKTLSEEEIATSPHSPKPLRTRSQSRTSNSIRPGEGDDFEPKVESTSHATIAHPALSAVTGGGAADASEPSNLGRASMLRRATEELEAALRGDGPDSPQSEREAKAIEAAEQPVASGPDTVQEKSKPSLEQAPALPAKDNASSASEPHAHFASSSIDKELPQAPASSEPPATSNQTSVQEAKIAEGEKVEEAAAKKASCCKACLVM